MFPDFFINRTFLYHCRVQLAVCTAPLQGFRLTSQITVVIYAISKNNKICVQPGGYTDTGNAQQQTEDR